MLKRIVFVFATLALAVASAKSYNVTLRDSVLAGKEIKAGSYKFDVNESNVVVTGNRQKIETAAKVQQEQSKHRTTTVSYAVQDHKVLQVRLGGTNLTLVFE